MMPGKIFQLHKRSSYVFDQIQDKYHIGSDCNVVALADGATQAFQSAQWAERLVQTFVRQPCFDMQQWLAIVIRQAEEFSAGPFQYSLNPALASLEKTKEKNGATSTFLGVRFNDKDLDLISCGDSNLFIMQGDALIGHPFNTQADLDGNGAFLNTRELINGKVSTAHFFAGTIPLNAGETALICSDALGRLLFQLPDAAQELVLLASFDDFLAFCVKYWESKQLQEDDITAIIIQHPSDSVQEIIPPADFSFPKEEELPFTPTKSEDYLFNETDMQNLHSHISRVENDVHLLHKRSSSQEMLLKVVIGLSVVNLLLVSFLIFSGGAGTEARESYKHIPQKDQDYQSIPSPRNERPPVEQPRDNTSQVPDSAEDRNTN